MNFSFSDNISQSTPPSSASRQQLYAACYDTDLCQTQEIYVISSSVRFLTIFFNIINFIVITKSRRLYSSVTGKCMLQIAGVDLLSGVVSAPFSSCLLSGYLKTLPHFCILHAIIILVCDGYRVVFMTIMNHRRFLVIIKPNRREGNTTPHCSSLYGVMEFAPWLTGRLCWSSGAN